MSRERFALILKHNEICAIMKEQVMNQYIFLPFIGLIFFPIYFLLSEVLNMDSVTAAIIGAAATIAAAIIGGIIAILAERRSIKRLISHLGFNDDEASLKKQLGVNSRSITEQLGVREKSITSQLGVNEKSITSQLGVENDDKSLTKQHEGLALEIAKSYEKLAGISSFLAAKEEKADKSLERLKENQAGIADKLSDMSDVIESYLRLLSTADEQNHLLSQNAILIEQLRTENAFLKEQLDEHDTPKGHRTDYDMER